MEAEQRKKIDELFKSRAVYLACGDVEKFNAITAEIATLERELRGTTTTER